MSYFFPSLHQHLRIWRPLLYFSSIVSAFLRGHDFEIYDHSWHSPLISFQLVHIIFELWSQKYHANIKSRNAVNSNFCYFSATHRNLCERKSGRFGMICIWQIYGAVTHFLVSSYAVKIIYLFVSVVFYKMKLNSLIHNPSPPPHFHCEKRHYVWLFLVFQELLHFPDFQGHLLTVL